MRGQKIKRAPFPRESEHAAIVRRYPAFVFPCVQCFCVSIPPAVWPTLLVLEDPMSICCKTKRVGHTAGVFYFYFLFFLNET